MLSHDEWLQSHHTIELLRWLEKKREEWTHASLEESVRGHNSNAAGWAGQYFAAKDILAKIRERKPNDESV